MPQNPKNYTDPELREEVKEEVQKSDKGGKPGQWSARKAQMTAHEYKSRGGDYTTSKEEQKPEQKNLDQWGDEEWQTKEGSGTAKQDDGTRKRYLPKKAWEELDQGEKESTEKKKLQGSKKGKQFVGNTGEAKRKRAEVSKEEKEGDEDKGDEGEEGEGGGGVEEGEEEEEEVGDEEIDEDEDDILDDEENEDDEQEYGEDEDDEIKADEVDPDEDEDLEEEEEEQPKGKQKQTKGKGEDGETATEGEQPDKKRRKKD